MYKLPKLKFLYQDLEPFIDTHTIGVHYHKHHKNYLEKLNELLDKNNYEYNYNLSELVYHIDEFAQSDKEDILFNLGGVLNHNLYWKGLNTHQVKPSGALKIYIESKYGCFEEFWEKIKKKALKLKGSGYTFVVLNCNKELEIRNLSNQETPLSYGYYPIFTIDLWEHAYYLNYKNEKKKYIENLKNVVDFSYASEIFNNIVKNG